MKISTQWIDRMTAELDATDKRYEIYNPYHPNFYVVPTMVVAEFDRNVPDFWESILTADVTGQRYRNLAAGTKAVGPGRGPSTEATTWAFRSRNSMPQGLIDLLHDVYNQRWATKKKD